MPDDTPDPTTPDDLTSESPTDETTTDAPASFDAWLEVQPETVKSLYAEHTKGLQNALKAERETRKAKEHELRELAAKAEEGSQAKAALEKAADELAEARRQRDFAMSAPREGVLDPELAFVAATTAGLVTDDGVDFEALKAKHPLLFSQKPKAPDLDGGAGGGGSNKGAKAVRLNPDELRAARAAGMSPEEYTRLRDELEQTSDER